MRSVSQTVGEAVCNIRPHDPDREEVHITYFLLRVAIDKCVANNLPARTTASRVEHGLAYLTSPSPHLLSGLFRRYLCSTSYCRSEQAKQRENKTTP